jgi:hypothetical protein
MSRTLLSLAGFQVIITGRFWVIAEAYRRTRAVALSLILLGVIVAAGIAVFVTLRMVSEIRTRMQAEPQSGASLSQLAATDAIEAIGDWHYW